MKKLALILLAGVLALLLAGCCLQHDMQPATCTEPATCAKCGKTEGEPLGHQEELDAAVEPTCAETGLTEGSHCAVCGEVLVPQETVPALGHQEALDAAVEPTCTETGLTEGSHCAVCGEVLVPQETVEALGHDWEPASFSEPAVCRVCGVTEGEALGAELFVNALNPSVPEEELRSVAEELMEEGETEVLAPAAREIRITGSARGLGEAQEYVNDSSILMRIGAEEESFVLDTEADIHGMKPIQAVLAMDGSGLSLALPGISEKIYRIDYALLQELMGQTSAMFTGGASQELYGSAEMAAELFGGETMRSVVLRYERILFSVANWHNTTETKGEYTLPALGETETCRILVCRPDLSDWRGMLRELLSTAAADEELEQLISQAAELAYAADTYARFSMTEEEYAEMVLTSFREELDDALQNVDDIAEGLVGVTAEIAYEGSRLYGLKLTNRYGDGVGYESCGALETDRGDALVLYENGASRILARNTVRERSGRVTGQFSIVQEGIVLNYLAETTPEGSPRFDLRLSVEDVVAELALESSGEDALLRAAYDASDAGCEIRVLISEAAEAPVLPEGEEWALTTEEELYEAFQEISEDITRAELILPREAPAPGTLGELPTSHGEKGG